MKKLLLLGASLLPALILAQQPPKTEPSTPIAKDEGQIIRLQGVPLESVLELYSRLTGRTILAAPNLPKVTFELDTPPLTNEEVIQLLDTALAQRQIIIIPQGNKTLKVVPAAEGPRQAMIPMEVKRDELPDAMGYVAVKVKIHHVLPSQLVDILNTFARMPMAVVALDDSLMLRDYAMNVKRMMEVIEDIDVKPTTFDEKIPLKNRAPEEISRIMTELTTGIDPPLSASMAFLPLNEAKALLVVAPFKAELERAKSIIEKLDQSQNSNPTQP